MKEKTIDNKNESESILETKYDINKIKIKK